MKTKPPSASGATGGGELYVPGDMEKEMDRMVDLAVKAAAKGENVEQLQEVMTAALPAKLREALKKKFASALQKRKMRPPAGEGDIPSRNVLSRIRLIFVASAKMAMQRVMNLMRQKPDLAAQVKQIGQTLIRQGVALDRTSQVTEADLGQISPTAGVGARSNQTGKGVLAFFYL